MVDPGAAPAGLFVSSEALRALIADLAARLVAALGAPGPRGGFALVGIVRGGGHLAARLADEIAALCGQRPLLGTVDITLYRDDLYTGLEKPVLGETRIDFGLDGRGVVLVDDVLFTGRTANAALHELMDYGRPRWVKLAALVDRGHRELPIAPDFVGLRLPTDLRDRVVVHLVEDGSPADGVELVRA